MSYLAFNVSFSGLIIEVGVERANFLLSITRCFVVSVPRGCLFLWVLRIGCIILL